MRPDRQGSKMRHGTLLPCFTRQLDQSYASTSAPQLATWRNEG